MLFGKILAGVMGVAMAVLFSQATFGASPPKSKAKTSVAAKSSAAKAVVRKKAKAKPKVASKKKSTRKPAARVVVEADFDSEGNPLIRSSAFYVQDLNTGEVLLQKNSSQSVPIASITKLMTAMVVLDAQQSLTEVLEVSDDEIDRIKGTSSHLGIGTRLTREEMLHLALMSSENRAAAALGRNYPGGRLAFLDAMNVKARLMGLSETRFEDGTGLTRHNVSSPRDLAILVANASSYPLIREFSTSTEYTAVLANGRSHTFRNTNALVTSADWQIDVSKTGYISESGKCLVMQAWMSDRPLVIVLLDSWGRFTRIGDANRIRKWVEASLARPASVASWQGASEGLLSN